MGEARTMLRVPAWNELMQASFCPLSTQDHHGGQKENMCDSIYALVNMHTFTMNIQGHCDVMHVPYMYLLLCSVVIEHRRSVTETTRLIMPIVGGHQPNVVWRKSCTKILTNT